MSECDGSTNTSEQLKHVRKVKWKTKNTHTKLSIASSKKWKRGGNKVRTGKLGKGVSKERSDCVASRLSDYNRVVTTLQGHNNATRLRGGGTRTSTITSRRNVGQSRRERHKAAKSRM